MKQMEKCIMRCLACNMELNDSEATRKSQITGEFIDLCNHCYSTISNDSEDVDFNDILDINSYLDIADRTDYS
jgi:hypothetical protein